MFDQNLRGFKKDNAISIVPQENVQTEASQQPAKISLGRAELTDRYLDSSQGQPTMAALSSVGDVDQLKIVQQHQVLGSSRNTTLLQTYQVGQQNSF